MVLLPIPPSHSNEVSILCVLSLVLAIFLSLAAATSESLRHNLYKVPLVESPERAGMTSSVLLATIHRHQICAKIKKSRAHIRKISRNETYMLLMAPILTALLEVTA